MNKTNLLIVTSSVLGAIALTFSFGSEAKVALSDSRGEPSTNVHAMLNHDSRASVCEQDLEVEVVTLTENGFDPPLITRSRGPFILALHNRSGEKELLLRISRAQGDQLYERRLAAGRRSQYQRLDLPPGSYRVSEASHPAWSCTLTINR